LSDKLITIARFEDTMEASIVKGKLASNGIESIIEDGRVIPHLPFFSSKKAVKLKVLEQDKETALKLIE